jgi:nitrite reductase/ring-hydroxylating ferredoxin subunit
VEGRDLALDAICPTHNQLMTDGRRDGFTWICPHGPGCSYDLRNGAKLGGGAGLQCYSTRIDSAGRLMIGFGVPFEPVMSSF